MTTDRYPDDLSPQPDRSCPTGFDVEPAPDTGRATVRLGGPDQLLAAVPYLLGFHPPIGSLVVIGLRQRSLVVLTRLDLPSPQDLADPDGLIRLWAALTPPIAASSADAFVVVGYTDGTRVEELFSIADTAPRPVLEVLRVHGERWWNLDCPYPTTCPQAACKPWGDLISDHPEVVVPLIAEGVPVPGTRADLHRILHPGPTATIRAVADDLPVSPTPAPASLYQALRTAHDERTDGPLPVSPYRASLLLQGLTNVSVRDACLVWDDDAAWWLWTELIRSAPPGWIAPVATLIAMIAYQRGDGVTATLAAQHALHDDPQYSLARLVLDSLHAAIPPEAIRRIIAQATATLPEALDRRPSP